MGGAQEHLKLVAHGEETTAGVPTVEQAFRLYAPYVATIALRLLGRPDAVDDVVQDVFIEAHKGFHAIRESDGVKRWLARVTVRVAHRRLKRRDRWRFLRFGGEVDYSNLADGDASPETRVLIARVYEALDALPPEQRIAWTLRYVQGERLDQVAILCECSLATAKRRISAAHTAIREVIDEG